MCEKLDADLEKINKDDVKALVREWNASSVDEFIKNIWDSRGIWHDAFEWLGDSYEEVVNLVMGSYLTDEDLKDESKIYYINIYSLLDWMDKN